jgi:hypothetical protein
MYRITPDRLWNGVTDDIVAKALRESTIGHQQSRT